MSDLNRVRAPLLSLCFLLTLLPPASWAADVEVQLDAGDGFVIKDNTGAIERLRVDEATGNISRNGALFVHTTGGNASVFVGDDAGNTGTTPLLGGGNTAIGYSALSDITTADGNSAVGAYALHSNTTGLENSAFGLAALTYNTAGNHNTAVGKDALRSNTTAPANSALGAHALQFNTTGSRNSAVGDHALYYNTTGARNSAFGVDALRNNTTGARNSAFGKDALRANSTGYDNAAFGQRALYANTTGNYNAALGDGALEANTTGSSNVAIGNGAGNAQTTGNDNIYLANPGTAAETGRIKIGTPGIHTQTLIAGIFGKTSGASLPVRVNAVGILGTTTSSIRFKEAVRNMEDASDVLMRLRPVTFRYREEVVVDGEDQTQYGLIAEEVAEVAPNLVVEDAEGRPYSVRYDALTPMLLNELQKQQRTNEEHRARDEGQQRTIERQQAQIATLLARVDAVESQRRGESMGTD